MKKISEWICKEVKGVDSWNGGLAFPKFIYEEIKE